MKFIEDDRYDPQPVSSIQSVRVAYTARHPEGAAVCTTSSGSFTTPLRNLEAVAGTIIPAEPGYAVWTYHIDDCDPADVENALFRVGTVVA